MITRTWYSACLLGGLMLLAVAAGCQTVAHSQPATPSFAVQADAGAPVARLAADVMQSAAAGQSALILLASGEDSLDARMMLIDRAQRSIDLQYYIFRPDSSGQALSAALQRAAARGVRVRLLLDDWGARPDNATMERLAANSSFEVRLFNPLAHPRAPLLSLLMDFERAQRRMHNKLLVVDGHAAITGGRNIGDEYFAGRPEFEFTDIDLMTFGPVVAEMARGFDLYWNDQAAVPVGASTRNSHNTAPQAEQPEHPVGRADRFAQRVTSQALRRFVGEATALQDHPGKVDPARPHGNSVLGQLIAPIMGQPQSHLLIISPYFVPGGGGVEQLRALATRGVRITVVTNSLAATDVPAVHAGYARYRVALLRAGVELYEVRADAVSRHRARAHLGSSRVSLHAKLMVVDRARTFVGSMNIDPRSLRLNTENGVVVDSTALAEELTQGGLRDLPRDAWRVQLDGDSLRWTGQRNGTEVVVNSEPQAGIWLRLSTFLMSWLPIEEYL